MNLSHLSNSELHRQTVLAGRNEREATLHLLHHLREVRDRKLYASLSYGSLWDYVVRALGYSESQASERINALNLMFSVPEVRKALEDGRVNLTQVAMVGRQVRAERKERKVSHQEIKNLVQ